jgi:hypothetical protein
MALTSVQFRTGSAIPDILYAEVSAMFLTHDNSGKGRSHNRDKDGSEACGVVIALSGTGS